jgi:hypothetical protein
MSMAWGPAVDAEVAYRQQRVRMQFRHRSGRRAARSTPRSSLRRDTGSSAFTLPFRPARAA